MAGDTSDCDDSDALVNADGVESCDGVDNDCNGIVDDDLVFVEYWFDSDGDGFAGTAPHPNNPLCSNPGAAYTTDRGLDCDDTAATVSPAGVEACNGLDDDCDGPIDEGLGAQTYYFDADGDGYAGTQPHPSNPLCSDPGSEWSVLPGRDCDDDNPALSPDGAESCNGLDDDCNGIVDDGLSYTEYWLDDDGDGFAGTQGHPANPLCSNPGSAYTTARGVDCDDSSASVSPAGVELCNGIDDDCDGPVDEGLGAQNYFLDDDGDGYAGTVEHPSNPLCADPGTGWSTSPGLDCDDSNGTLSPDAVETCDGLDNDCNGVADDGLAFVEYWLDDDGDGFAGTQGHPSNPLCSDPGSAYTTVRGGDCDDGSATVSPVGVEACNGVDDDCDGSIDEELGAQTYYFDADGDGYAGTVEHPNNPLCSDPGPAWSVLPGLDCDDDNPALNPDGVESCDGLDNDCNGIVDDGLPYADYWLDDDGDGYAGTVGHPANPLCSDPGDAYVGARGLDCDDSAAAIHPDAVEVCDDLDNDCNGLADDGLAFVEYFLDDDGDGYAGLAPHPGNPSCSDPGGSWSALAGLDCDDSNPATNPDGAESCNGLDDDCDGVADDGLPAAEYWLDNDGDGYAGTAGHPDNPLCADPGLAYTTERGLDCDDGRSGVNPEATETCNGLDDDCNGQADDGLPGAEYFFDGDGDGYPGTSPHPGNPLCADPGTGWSTDYATDCDDDSVAINPEATETCDGLDQDCDGSVDDGLDFEDYYVDNDTDGWGGTPHPANPLCREPTGYVLDSGDCDDANFGRNPGRAESCNGIDDDCNGSVDDTLDYGDWYADGDGDGFGDADLPFPGNPTCETPDGFVRDDTDCDDGEPGAYPGATEVAGNAIDEDCDGEAQGVTDSVRTEVPGLACNATGSGGGHGPTPWAWLLLGVWLGCQQTARNRGHDEAPTEEDR